MRKNWLPSSQLCFQSYNCDKVNLKLYGIVLKLERLLQNFVIEE